MSKNIQALLKALNLEDADKNLTDLLSDTDNQEVIDRILKAAQGYSKPFIESELRGQFDNERGTLKGKYFKDAARKVNSAFGNVLTNKELDSILDDPKNEGKTFDAVLDQVKEKAMSKSDGSDAEIKNMLDKANGRISELEQTITQKEQEWKQKYDNDISEFKLNTTLHKRLIAAISDKTSMPADKVAALLIPQLKTRAVMKPKGDNDIDLYDPAKPEQPLKKNETTLYKFDSLVEDMISEFDLAKKSNGTHKTGAGAGGNGGGQSETAEPKSAAAKSAAGLANVLAAAE